MRHLQQGVTTVASVTYREAISLKKLPEQLPRKRIAIDHEHRLPFVRRCIASVSQNMRLQYAPIDRDRVHDTQQMHPTRASDIEVRSRAMMQ